MSNFLNWSKGLQNWIWFCKNMREHSWSWNSFETHTLSFCRNYCYLLTVFYFLLVSIKYLIYFQMLPKKTLFGSEKREKNKMKS